MMTRYINRLIIAILLASTVIGCQRADFLDTTSKSDDSMVELSINFEPTYTSQVETRSGSYVHATIRELTMSNTNLFIFTNNNPVSAARPDPNGQFMIYSSMTYDAPSNEYKAVVQPIDGPVAAIGIANLPDDILQELKQIYETGESLTYSEFVNKCQLPIKTVTDSDGRVTVSDDNKILMNLNDDSGILPISVDPIQLPKFTQDVVDAASALNPTASNSRFGYSRMDVILDATTMSAEQLAEIELIEAYLCNVPVAANFTGVGNVAAKIEYTKPVTPGTNINTDDQPAAAGSNDIIQGLYLYPNSLGAKVEEEDYVYIILKAKTKPEAMAEFFKVLVRYDKDGDNLFEHEVLRNTKYNFVVKNFADNGYPTMEEALDNPPSNVEFDITIDSDTGNEFVVSNGSSFMSLSNTQIDLFGQLENFDSQEFLGFTVYFEINTSAYTSVDDNFASTTKLITTSSPGLTVVNADDFSANFKEKEKYEVKLMLDSNFAGSGELTIRIGNLVKVIGVRLVDLADSGTQITAYEQPQYLFAYLDYTQTPPDEVATWVRFGGTADLEYESKSDGGIPIELSSLTEGVRDNFSCPIFIYNKSGESIRTYISQVDVMPIDYSDIGVVNSYIGGSYTTASTLTLSNTYILTPGTDKARKYYIPVSSRIKEVWDNYATDEEMLDEYKDTDGSFKMPEDWECHVVWYDSQRIYDGDLEFKKDLPNPLTGEERFSVVIPANMENFGNVLIAVVDGNDNILWNWTLWITDYEPTEIAKKYSPVATNYVDNGNGVGSYTLLGYTPHTDGAVIEDAIHHYSGGIWSDSGIYGKRYIMDRHLGAYDNTLVGHGTLLNSTNTKCIAAPVSGSGLYQFGSPRPVVGEGALKADGTQFSYEVAPGYVTVIHAAQTPSKFHYGTGGFGQWVTNTDPVNANNVIWYDKNIKYSSASDANDPAKAKKSIFDPSPLGWMVTAKETFKDFGRTTTLTRDVDPPYSTKDIYMGFADFYYASYRTSAGGGFRLAKQSTVSSTIDGYVRSNESYNTGDSYSLSMNSYNNTFFFAGYTGKAAGISVRCVSQAEY